MSGHSKWATTKHKKAVIDSRRAKNFAKLIKAIEVAARNGGPDMDGNPTMDEYYNVNGSYYAIEGITSPDGRVLGKMAHSERKGTAVAVNIYGDQDQKIFESGVAYFS